MTRVNVLRGILALAILVAVGYAGRALDMHAVVRLLAQADPRWLAIAILCYGAVLPLWALEWHLLAPRSPTNSWPRMLGIVALTSTILNTSAFLVGEVAGAGLLVTRAGLAPGESVAVLAMDQLLVGIAKCTLFATAGALFVLPPGVRTSLPLLVGGVSALAMIVAVLSTSPAGVVRRVRMFSPRLADWLREASRGLAVLANPAVLATVVLLSLLKKGCEVVALIAGMRMFGMSLAPETAILALAVLNMATLLPIIPGNLGPFEGALVLVYTQLGMSAEKALAIAVLQHACYFVALAVPGCGWLFASSARRVAPAS